MAERKRITDKDLEQAAKELNELTGGPVEPSHFDSELGHYWGNVGHHFIHHAYGGVRLDRMVSPSGEMDAVLFNGYKSKRELWNAMRAFIQGIRYAQSSTQNSD